MLKTLAYWRGHSGATGRQRGARAAMMAMILGSATVAASTTMTAPAAAAPGGNAAANLTCGWSPRIGAGTFNMAFPDTFANYWSTYLPAVPGATLTIRGQFPYARYMSFTTYSKGGEVAGSLNDQAIAADDGGVNPFTHGADREATTREYTVRIVMSAPPPSPEPNTLYTGDAAGFVPVVYRVYRPNAERDATAGAGLPRLTFTMPDGVARELADCGTENAVHDPNALYPGRSGRLPGRATSLPHAPDWKPASGGGYFPNPDNKYLTTLLEPGRVAVIRGKLPTTPATYRNQPVMGTGQVRYWSLCSNKPVSTAVTACVVDDETTVDADGFYTIVVSSSNDRPTNTVGGCGIGWLPSDFGSDLLIMRNMLPNKDFRYSIQNADPADPKTNMGPYYPEVRYTSKADIEAAGCSLR